MKQIRIILLLLFGFTFILNANDEDFFNKVNNYYNDQKFKKVEKLCLRELKSNPTSLNALFFLSAVYIFTDEHEEADPWIKRFESTYNTLDSLKSIEDGIDVNTIDIRHVGLYYIIGQKHVLDENYNNAIYWLRLSITTYSSDPMLNFYLGLSYMKTQDFENALKYFVKYRELAPDEPSGYYNIACVYALQNDIENSISWLKQAIKNYPQFKEDIKLDEDFDLIRTSAQFEELLK